MQFFFCYVVGLFILLMAQAVCAVVSLVALYVDSSNRLVERFDLPLVISMTER